MARTHPDDTGIWHAPRGVEEWLALAVIALVGAFIIVLLAALLVVI